jgi:hypothetical protein
MPKRNDAYTAIHWRTLINLEVSQLEFAAPAIAKKQQGSV